MEAKDQETGEFVAYLPPGEGTRSLWVLGELVTYKITSYQTGGAYSLFEVITQPGSGLPPHVHHREEESFYVLEGKYKFLVEGHAIDAEVGSLVYVPKGNLHAYDNVSEEPGRLLVGQTPGGLYEQLIEKLGEETKDGRTGPVTKDPPDMERIARIAAQYGIEIPPPDRSYNRQGESREGDSSMFARMFTIEGRHEQLNEVARTGEEQVLPALQRLDGFDGLLVLANRQNGKILIVTFWGSEEAMRGGEEAAHWFRAFSAKVAGGEVTNVERYEVVSSEKRGVQH